MFKPLYLADNNLIHYSTVLMNIMIRRFMLMVGNRGRGWGLYLWLNFCLHLLVCDSMEEQGSAIHVILMGYKNSKKKGLQEEEMK